MKLKPRWTPFTIFVAMVISITAIWLIPWPHYKVATPHVPSARQIERLNEQWALTLAKNADANRTLLCSLAKTEHVVMTSSVKSYCKEG